jgi:hypothetical protein
MSEDKRLRETVDRAELEGKVRDLSEPYTDEALASIPSVSGRSVMSDLLTHPHGTEIHQSARKAVARTVETSGMPTRASARQVVENVLLEHGVFKLLPIDDKGNSQRFFSFEPGVLSSMRDRDGNFVLRMSDGSTRMLPPSE